MPRLENKTEKYVREVLLLILILQDNVKKMLERADQLQRGKISTHVVKAIFASNSDEQFAAAMKQLEGK